MSYPVPRRPTPEEVKAADERVKAARLVMFNEMLKDALLG